MGNYDFCIMMFTQEYFTASGLYPTSRHVRMFIDIFDRIFEGEKNNTLDEMTLYKLDATEDKMLLHIVDQTHNLICKLEYMPDKSLINADNSIWLHINDFDTNLNKYLKDDSVLWIHLYWDENTRITPVYQSYGIDIWSLNKGTDNDGTLASIINSEIKKKGYKPSDVYNKAQISRQIFSNLKNGITTHPKKNIILALAAAFEYSVEETSAFLQVAGHKFPDKLDKADTVIKKCFEEGGMSVAEINYELEEANLDVFLGSR